MTITNEQIKLSLSISLNKKYENITEEDLKTIKKICIDSQGLSKEEAEKNIFEVLSNCPNLLTISFIHTFLTNEIVKKISCTQIEKIYLQKSAFEIESEIIYPKTLKELELRNCFIDEYSNLLKLPISIETLNISFPADESTIYLSHLNGFDSLKTIILDGCIVTFENTCLKKCEYLSLLGTAINEKDIVVLQNQSTLKKILISEIFIGLPGIEELRKNCEIKTNLIDYTYEPLEENVQKQI